MTAVFYLASAIAIIATALAITRLNAVHALIYLVLSLLAVAIVFYTLGAPFAAALEVITYAGAIMVLFVIILMTLNAGKRPNQSAQAPLRPRVWIGPVILAAVLLAELVYASTAIPAPATGPSAVSQVSPKAVGLLLFGPWLAGVELVSMLLLAGIVGAYRLGAIPAYGWIRPEDEEIIEEEERNHAPEPAGERTVVSSHPVHVGVSRTDHAA